MLFASGGGAYAERRPLKSLVIRICKILRLDDGTGGVKCQQDANGFAELSTVRDESGVPIELIRAHDVAGSGEMKL
jgi:hypothetical protein